MKFSIAKRSDGRRVGKLAGLKSDSIYVDSAGMSHPDVLEVREVASPFELAEIVKSLGPSALLVSGIPKSGSTHVSIKPKRNLDADSIPLSDETIEWVWGPGLMLLDHDPKDPTEGGRPELNLNMAAFKTTIEKVIPGLMRTYARWPSSSSCISGEGVAPREVRGFHYGLFVENGSDVARAGRFLFKRLVLAGLGYGFVTKTGSILIRTIVDDHVWRPSHKIFAGGVAVQDGLTQRRTEGIKYSESTTPVDTMALLPDLTEDEEQQYAAERERLMTEAAPLAASRRADYEQGRVEQRAQAIVKLRNLELAEAKTLAREQVRGELGSGLLAGDAEILTHKGWTTVDDILARPSTWHGLECADPLEPEYGSGVGVAKIYLDGATSLIHSFAHGGRNFPLRSSPEAMFGDSIDVPVEPAVAADPAEPAVAAVGEPTSGAVSSIGDRYGVRNAADLMRKTFPPVQWVVQDLLPRGCYLLGGKPKVGKSWLVLSLMLCVAQDQEFLGRKVEAAECLYLALEDSDRRMQDRISRLTDDFDDPDELVGFQYHTEWPRGPEGVDRLDKYLRDNPAVKVVAIDTLARVKPPGGKNTNAYEADYAALAPYQTTATKRGVTIILVTHLKKAPSQDPFDDITGSLGQAGAVDGMLVLERPGAGGKGLLTLRGRGRDLDGDWELLIERDKSGQFLDRGSPATVAAESSRAEVLEVLESFGGKGATANEIHKALPGRKSIGSTRNLLKRMLVDELIERLDGRYVCRSAIDDDVPFCAEQGHAPSSTRSNPSSACASIA